MWCIIRLWCAETRRGVGDEHCSADKGGGDVRRADSPPFPLCAPPDPSDHSWKYNHVKYSLGLNCILNVNILNDWRHHFKIWWSLNCYYNDWNSYRLTVTGLWAGDDGWCGQGGRRMRDLRNVDREEERVKRVLHPSPVLQHVVCDSHYAPWGAVVRPQRPAYRLLQYYVAIVECLWSKFSLNSYS